MNKVPCLLFVGVMCLVLCASKMPSASAQDAGIAGATVEADVAVTTSVDTTSVDTAPVAETTSVTTSSVAVTSSDTAGSGFQIKPLLQTVFALLGLGGKILSY